MLSYDKNPGAHYGSIRTSSLSSAAATAIPSQTSLRSNVMPQPRHLFIVTGPAGCGKSTLAEFLAKQFKFHYIEGDNWHPPSNVAKMSAGIPLNDGDRWDWLTCLRDEAVKNLEAGAKGAILTCSALKYKYRDVIRVASYNDHNVRIHFIYLQASEALLLQRVGQRENHYAKADLVKSQLADLEEPRPTEHDVLSIDVSGTEEEVRTLAARLVADVLEKDRLDSLQ